MKVNLVARQLSVLWSHSSEKHTAYDLAMQLVDTIPVDWTRTDLRIVDPSCGRGTLLLAVMQKLVDSGHSPEAAGAMLYGADNSALQARLAATALQLAGSTKTNVYCEDSLKRRWNMEFDVVIGNPPYQKANKTGRDDDNLWSGFVKLSHKLCKKGGYVALVTPASWGSLGTNQSDPGSMLRRKLFNKKQVIHVDFTAKKHFPGVGSSFTSHVVRNLPHDPTLKTHIVFDEKTVEADFNDYICWSKDYNQTMFFDIINDFRSRSSYPVVQKDPYPASRASMPKKIAAGYYSRTKTNTLPYRAYHTNAQTHLYTTYRNTFHDQWKLVFSYSGTWSAEVTNDCSLTDASLCILCDSQAAADSVKSVMTSEPVTFLIKKVFKWSGYYSGLFIGMIPELPRDRIYSNEDVYQLLFTPAHASQLKAIIEAENNKPKKVKKANTKTKGKKTP